METRRNITLFTIESNMFFDSSNLFVFLEKKKLKLNNLIQIYDKLKSPMYNVYIKQYCYYRINTTKIWFI